jgi:hypothetical protein
MTSVLSLLGQCLKSVASRIRRPKSVDLSKKDAEKAVFCFLGEFGYEMISWIPYLLFLKKTLGFKLRTISRPGSRIFYYFSDEHREIDSSLVGDMWGASTSYIKLAKEQPDSLLVFPGQQSVNEKRIVIGGYAWTNPNIHGVISLENYEVPDYSFIRPESPIKKRPFVVINNKYVRQWPSEYDSPINFFDLSTIARLRDLFLDAGFGVVYNHFVEPTSSDEYWDLKDRDVMTGIADAYDMRAVYSVIKDKNELNRLQCSLYNAAAFVVGPQGGNLYLPALCRRDLIILMKAGVYRDYQQFERIFGIHVETFYEQRHLIHWLKTVLLPNWRSS